jgi:adenine-specific DNA-methyltransferase
MATINFKGKSYVQNHHLTLKYHHLVPDPSASLTDKISLHDNLIIHGDNLLALKALLPTYAGKVKCIYIDPPYNTGNEGWIYNDNVNSPMMQEWLKTNQPIDKEDLARHDKWLCMMTPRLKLLRELLRDDGVIFVSIDDNEVHHLRMLMDEIFGEENFVASIIWEKKYSSQNDAKYLSETHDYIIVYARSKKEWHINLLPRTKAANSRYTNPDNDPRGLWKPSDLLRMEHRDNSVYSIVSPTGKSWEPKAGTSWRHPRSEMLALISDNQVWFGINGNAKPQRKRFLNDVQSGLVPKTIWNYSDCGHTQEATQQLNKVFVGTTLSFDNPKPVRLLKHILQISTNSDSNDIILDSFAGSGTTAHAVLSLNQEDTGNRKFILIEMENYAKSLTAERMKRVIKGIPEAKDEILKSGLSGSFSFFDLGNSVEMQAILEGDTLPFYEDLARYVFYTATGDEFDLSKVDPDRNFIGESKDFEVYLLYQPDLNYLRSTSLDLHKAEKLGLPEPNCKKRLVFAPMKYLDADTLERYRIEYC